jgi:hypothetical protein
MTQRGQFRMAFDKIPIKLERARDMRRRASAFSTIPRRPSMPTEELKSHWITRLSCGQWPLARVILVGQMRKAKTNLAGRHRLCDFNDRAGLDCRA